VISVTVKEAKVATEPDTSARTYSWGLVGRGVRCSTRTGTPPVAIEARKVALTSTRSVRFLRLRSIVVASLRWIGSMTHWISSSDRLAQHLAVRVQRAARERDGQSDGRHRQGSGPGLVISLPSKDEAPRRLLSSR
jgi:hypothetical protein